MFSNKVAVDDIEQARYTRRQPCTQSGGYFNPQNNKITFKIPGNGLMWDPNRSYISFDAQVVPTSQTYGPNRPWTYTLYTVPGALATLNNQGLNTVVGIGEGLPVTAAVGGGTTLVNAGSYWIQIGGVNTTLILASDTIAIIIQKLQQHPIIRKYSQNGDGWAARAVQGNGYVGLFNNTSNVPVGAAGPCFTITSPSLAPTTASLNAAITDVINISYTGYLWGTNIELMNLHPIVISNAQISTVAGAQALATNAVPVIYRQYPIGQNSIAATTAGFSIPNSSFLGGIQTPSYQPNPAQYGAAPYYAGSVTLPAAPTTTAPGSNLVYNPALANSLVGTAAPAGYVGTGVADTCAFPENISNLFYRATVRVGSTPIADLYQFNLVKNVEQVLKQGKNWSDAAGDITQGYGPQQQTIDGFNRTQRSMAGSHYAMKFDLGPLEHPMIPLDPLGNTNLEVDLYLEAANKILEISQYGLASTTPVAAITGTATTAGIGGVSTLVYPVKDTTSAWSYSITNIVYVLEYVKLFDPRRDQLLSMLPIVMPFNMSQVTTTQIPAGVNNFDYNFITRVSNLNTVYFLLRPTAASSNMTWPNRMSSFNRGGLTSFYIRVDTQNFSDPIPTDGISSEGFVELEKLFTASPLDVQNSTRLSYLTYPHSILDQQNASTQNVAINNVATQPATNGQTVPHLTLNNYAQPFYPEDNNFFYFGVRMERSPYRTNILSGVNTAVTSATIILKMAFGAGFPSVGMDLIAISNYDSLWEIGANSSSVNQ